MKLRIQPLYYVGKQARQYSTFIHNAEYLRAFN